jgi:hypothetical protein
MELILARKSAATTWHEEIEQNRYFGPLQRFPVNGLTLEKHQ